MKTRTGLQLSGGGVLAVENGGTGQSNLDDVTVGSAKKATQDADGNVISTTYGKLSQVVRFDAKQNITPEQAQQVLENLGQNTSNDSTMSKILATYSFGTGYSTYVKLGTFYIGDSNIEIDINSGLSDQNTSGKIVLVAVNGIIQIAEGRWDQKANNVEFWYNVRDKEGNYGYLDIYCNNVPYGKIYCTVRGAGATLIEKAINVSGLPSTKVALNDTFRFITDPLKLAPSTANGWTQTTATGSLPSAGVYLVGATVDDNGTSGTLSPCIMVFDGTNSAIVFAIVLATQSYLAYLPSVSKKKWILQEALNNTELDIINIYYKRIA